MWREKIPLEVEIIRRGERNMCDVKMPKWSLLDLYLYKSMWVKGHVSWDSWAYITGGVDLDQNHMCVLDIKNKLSLVKIYHSISQNGSFRREEFIPIIIFGKWVVKCGIWPKLHILTRKLSMTSQRSIHKWSFLLDYRNIFIMASWLFY